MRKIEEKMNKAIRSRENFKLDNTEVWISDTGTAHVYLFDNLIASFTSSDMTFHSDCVSCGTWKTRTTKSRLNAMLSEFHNELGIFQRKGEWYIDTPYGWIAWDSHSIRVFNHPTVGKVIYYYDTQAGMVFTQTIGNAA